MKNVSAGKRRHCSIGSPNSHECTIKALAIAREQRISISSTRSGIYTFDITHGCDCIFIFFRERDLAHISLRRKQLTNSFWSRQIELDRPKRTKDKRQRNTEKGLQTQRTATNDKHNRRSKKREATTSLATQPATLELNLHKGYTITEDAFQAVANHPPDSSTRRQSIRQRRRKGA